MARTLATPLPWSRAKARVATGSMYKVLAKILAGRVKVALTHIIRPNQMGFVEGRSIIDNTFMAQEALEWAEESE